jgi:transcriptional regulator with XRE-family HTH domain
MIGANGERRVPEVRLGAKFRAARSDRGMTMEQVAAEAGVTKSFISRLERDEVSPSVASLVALCEALRIRVGDLFDPPETSLVRAGTAVPARFGPEGLLEYLLTPKTVRSVNIYQSVIDPGMASSDVLYSHESEVEIAYVLHGAIDVELGDQSIRLERGDTFTFSPREPHRFSNPSSTERAEILWVFAPAL